MKAIMYHYVRPTVERWPHFRYLPLDSFRRQLDHFAATEGFLSRDDFFAALADGQPRPGVVLTFDDGLAEHHDHVLPLLEERGLWGIFYVPTAVLDGRRLLDVHRIHVLLGLLGGVAAMEALEPLIRPEMLVERDIATFRTIYNRLDDHEATTLFKRTLNYFVSYEYRGELLDRLMAGFFDDEAALARDFYLSPEKVRRMADKGMVMGSHGDRHLVFSRLDFAEQRREITGSFERLAAVAGRPVTTFCYPYGGPDTFTADTERLLDEVGCRASFTIESRAVAAEDLIHRPQALPRFDCNLFPHGTHIIPLAAA